MRSGAPTGDARNQSSEPEADTGIEPARRETDTCPAEQRRISVKGDGGERDAPGEREPPADPFEEWKTKETTYYRQPRRDTEGRLSEWTPKLCAGAFGTTLYLGANLARPPEWTELLGAAWTCWILGLLTWYASGLTDIRADDTAVNNISRLTAADHNGVAAEEDVFGRWNRQTGWLAGLTGFLLLTGVICALAFAWINIGKIGGPNCGSSRILAVRPRFLCFLIRPGFVCRPFRVGLLKPRAAQRAVRAHGCGRRAPLCRPRWLRSFCSAAVHRVQAHCHAQAPHRRVACFFAINVAGATAEPGRRYVTGRTRALPAIPG